MYERTPQVGLRLPLGSETQSNECKQPAGMVENFDQILKEHVLAEKRQDRQNQCIAWDGDQRLNHIPDAMFRMLREVASSEQRSPKQVRACAARRWNNFINSGLIAPEEQTAQIHGAPEEVHVLPCGFKCRPKGGSKATQNALPEQHVASTGLFPSQLVAGRVFWTIEESPLPHPLWWFYFEIWLDRPKDAIRPRRPVHLEEIQQPIAGRKFVVIDKGNQIAVGVLHCFVPRQGNILPGLDAVHHSQLRRTGKIVNWPLCGCHAVIVGNNNRIREQALCPLIFELT